MRAIAPLALSLTLSLAAVLPAAARPMDAGEARKMETAVNVYLGAIGRGEADRVVGALPPRIKNIFAGSAGIEAGQLERTLTAQTAALLKAAKFANFSADFAGVEATDSVLTDGSKVTWVIVPTSFTAATAKGKTLNEQPLLAVNENGQWYMMRVEGAQQKQLVSIAYPFLQNVTFPESRVSPAK
ncbi:hypothetical protein V8J36_03450 [Frigidibacter sp. MR17.14]|uniref:hypothetical protein n=1 Tax=Frigidibacter sp. MR17.14 TaxID=3126509 RepID=UPI003012F047